MSGDAINIAAGGTPTVVLGRIGTITTYEVQEMELDQLDSLVADENKAASFTTFVGGIFVATGTSWLTAGKLSSIATAVFVGILFTSTILTGWFGMTWYRAHKNRLGLLTKVRERANRNTPTATRTESNIQNLTAAQTNMPTQR